MKNKKIVDEYELVNISINNKEQIISKFSYDEDDKLNKDLSDFIIDKTKLLPVTKNIQLNFYTQSKVEKSEIETTLQNHFKEEYLEVKSELKNRNIYAIMMLFLGLITLSVLFLTYKFFNNAYFETLLEITVWVFVWEAVDSFFLQRPRIRRRCLHMKNLYKAKVEVINAKSTTKSKTKDLL